MTDNFTAKKIAALAVMAALISSGKFALNVVPNVEVVTLLCAVFGYCFGLIAILPTCVFVLIEMAVWGVGPWVVAYFLHFNVVCVTFCLLGKLKCDNPFIVALIALCLTFLFGLLTSALDLMTAGFQNFFARFFPYYARGAVFYIVHCASNTAIFLALFRPLAKLISKIKSNLEI